jgi:hypothetical protein
VISQVRVVSSFANIRETADALVRLGHLRDHIYVLAYDKELARKAAEEADIKEVGWIDEGVYNTVANLFRSREEELRAKLEALGCTESDALYFAREMEMGKFVVAAVRNNLTFLRSPEDQRLRYAPRLARMKSRSSVSSAAGNK